MTGITEATIINLEELSIIFDLYRQFYRQPTNIENARRFLKERIINKESVIFISTEEDETITGFVQLYPIFTSVGLKRCWLLNDLFVKKDYRKKGIARKLLDKCKKHAEETNASGIILETSKNNLEGNVLYPTEGFILQDESNFYFWKSSF